MDDQMTHVQPRPDHRSESSFLNIQGPEIDDAFGGLTVRDDGTLKIPDHYKKLQPTLQLYMRQDGKYHWGANPTKREWEALFNDVATAEARASESDRGPFDVFDRMMVKVGERADQIDPWINLIPDEFGLCVVKSAFAILLDTARSHSDKRQLIFDAFLAVRDTIGEASSKGIHFQTEPSVYRQAGDLYEVIVDAIQELLSMVKFRKHRKWPFKTRREDQSRDPQTILKEVDDSAKALSLAVDNCRDAVIKNTGRNATQILGEVKFIGWKAAEIKYTVSKVHIGQEEQLSMLKKVQQTQQALLEMAQSRDEANLKLLDSFRQQEKKYQITITKLEKFIKEQHMGPDPSIGSLARQEGLRAVISLDRLLRILSAPSPELVLAKGNAVGLDVLRLRQSEHETVLTTTTRFSPRSQSQAHSILNQNRFFNWMHQSHPDMLLVDGNIHEFAQDNVSPMSLLCANLGLTMSKREPDSVFAHFYCGLHNNARGDDWYGPVGMLRSLAIQLLVALVERESLDLSFLDRRSCVRGLECQDLETLSDLLHDTVRQFDAETTIYCIIDNVSKFDVDFRGTFLALKVAIRRLQNIVRDDKLRPRLKMLMTVPFRSSVRLRQITYDEFYLALPSQVLGPRGLSESSVMSSISRPPSSLIAPGRLSSSQDGTSHDWEDYDDE